MDELESKRQQLQVLQREIAEIQHKINQAKQEKGLVKYYEPLATAIVDQNLYYRYSTNCRSFRSGWYTGDQILGKPDLKVGDVLTLLKVAGSEMYWFPFREDGKYSKIDHVYNGLFDCMENRGYLKEIEWLK